MNTDKTAIFVVVYIAIVVISLVTIMILPLYFPSLGNYLVPVQSEITQHQQ